MSNAYKRWFNQELLRMLQRCVNDLLKQNLQSSSEQC